MPHAYREGRMRMPGSEAEVLASCRVKPGMAGTPPPVRLPGKR